MVFRIGEVVIASNCQKLLASGCKSAWQEESMMQKGIRAIDGGATWAASILPVLASRLWMNSFLVCRSCDAYKTLLLSREKIRARWP